MGEALGMVETKDINEIQMLRLKPNYLPPSTHLFYQVSSEISLGDAERLIIGSIFIGKVIIIYHKTTLVKGA